MFFVKQEVRWLLQILSWCCLPPSLYSQLLPGSCPLQAAAELQPGCDVPATAWADHHRLWSGGWMGNWCWVLKTCLLARSTWRTPRWGAPSQWGPLLVWQPWPATAPTLPGTPARSFLSPTWIHSQTWQVCPQGDKAQPMHIYQCTTSCESEEPRGL